MVSYKIIYKEQKVKADNFILYTIIIVYIALFFFFTRIAIMGFIVFPLSILIISGFYKLYCVIFPSIGEEMNKVLNLLYGLLLVPFAVYVLYRIFTHHTIDLGYMIYFIAITMIIIGAAAIFKGIFISAFKKNSRIFNIIIGLISIFFSIFSCFFSKEFFFFNLFIHLLLLILNGIGRAALYLSEYRISLLHLRKIRIFKFLLQIIREPPYNIEYVK